MLENDQAPDAPVQIEPGKLSSMQVVEKNRSDTPLKCFQTEILNKGLIFTDSSIKDG